MDPSRSLLVMLATKGSGHYGEASVTQLEHALQCAAMAEISGASPHMITAALLHDIGHLINGDDGAADRGVDMGHEHVGADYLAQWFPKAVTEPVRLHVAAKRYLVSADSRYGDRLSPASRQSLTVQGGPFSDSEIDQFMAQDFAEDGVTLRIWDESAKVGGLKTPGLHHFKPFLQAALKSRD
jgi:phosphonate degradation associated HDIG domain protein